MFEINQTRRFIFSAPVMVALAVLSVSASATVAQEQPRVSIGASGSAVRTPNRAWVRFAVTAEAKEPVQAIDANAVEVKKLLDQLATRGIAAKNLQTASLSLRPKYEVKREGNREIRGNLLGYVASKVVTATIEDLSQVPVYVREFPLAGTLRISDIGFFSTESEAAHSEALVDAIRRAQKAATTAVKSAGRQLGPVTSINLSITADRASAPRFVEQRQYGVQPEETHGSRLIVEPGEETFGQQVNMQWALR